MMPEVEAMLILEALAAVGCVTIVWVVLGWLMRPKPVARVWVVLPLRQDGKELEPTLRQLRFLQKSGKLRATTLLADYGLTEQGRQAAALQEDENTLLVAPRHLGEYIRLETMEHGSN